MEHLEYLDNNNINNNLFKVKYPPCVQLTSKKKVKIE